MAATRSRSTTPRTPKPTLKVTGINLDTLKREGEQAARAELEPYKFVLGGELFILNSIMDLDWKLAASFTVNDAVRSIRALMEPEDFARFTKHKLPLWKLLELMRSYEKYHKIDPQSLGEEGALPT